MKEHPIPQDVTGYRFHIIGNMTLKQFVELGIGCVIAVGLYSTNLPDFIKWPIIGLALGTGAMAAFMPIEERPLDHWIITFFRTLYRPTQYFWKKHPQIPRPFLYEASQSTSTEQEVDFSPARRQRIHEFMLSLGARPSNPNNLSIEEYQRLHQIMEVFESHQVTAGQSKPGLARPRLDVRVRTLRQSDDVQSSIRHLTTAGEIIYAATEAADDQGSGAASRTVEQVAEQVRLTQAQLVAMSESAKQTQEEQALSEQQISSSGHAFVAHQAAGVDNSQSQAALFNSDLPFPLPPTTPNTLVGMILTPHNELIPGAIVQVATTDGVVARAVKTNALGQFFITTPLANGEYTVTVERDGQHFAPQRLSVKGQLLAPMEIRSQ